MAFLVTTSGAGHPRSRSQPRRCPAVRALETEGDARITLEIHREIVKGLAKEVAAGAREAVNEVTFFTDLLKPKSNNGKAKAALRPPEKVAGADSLFISAGDPAIRVHCKRTRCSPKTRSPAKRVRDGIMVHGLLGSTFSFRKIHQLTANALQGTVVSFDLPGFGLTQRPNPLLYKMRGGDDSPYSLNNASKLASQMIGACRMKNAVLFGHSLGGAIALEAALSGAPIDALVLFSPAAKIPSPPRIVKQVFDSLLSTPLLGDLAVRESFERAVEGERVRHLVRRNFHDPSRICLEETVAGYTEPMQVRDWHKALRNFSISFDGFNLLEDERLLDLKIPVLIIAGEYDRVLSVKDMHDLSARLQNSEVRVIPDCGHIPQEELPAETIAHVQDWLDKTLS